MTTDELRPVWPDAPRVGPDAPFPRYRFLAGLHPHPERDPRGHAHDAPDAAARWSAAEMFRRGVDLYHAGYLWEAHEAWEGLWREAPDGPSRALLQGLIQLAAALIKAHTHRPRGVARLSAAVRARLEGAEPRFGLDLDRLRRDVDRCFAGAVDEIWSRAPRLHVQ